MKRLTACIVLCLLMAGCTATRVVPEQHVPDEPVMPVVTPMPTPEPFRVMFMSDSVHDYSAPVRGAAEEYGWRLDIADFSDKPVLAGYDGLIALRTKEDTDLSAIRAAADAGVKAAVVDMYPGESFPNAAYARYDGGREAEVALDYALLYPPHDTPVRVIALLAQEDSPGDVIFHQRLDEGKIFSRGLHYETDEKQTLEEFLEKQLDRYVEGLVDAIYAEDNALAARAILVLNRLERTDMEVFAVPKGELRLQQALIEKWIFPVAIGADIENELVEQAHALLALMEGGKPEIRAFEATAKNAVGENPFEEVEDIHADEESPFANNETEG